MDVTEAIRGRISVKRFTEEPLERETVEELLELATLAPNHRMTQPWRFTVLGPEQQRIYGELKGHLKSQKVEDEAAAVAVKDKVARDVLAIPCVVVVRMKRDEDPGVREEDHAAVFMGIENLLLAAWERGIGGYIHTGGIMEQDRLRELAGAAADERIVAVVDLGRPSEVPTRKERTDVTSLTTWTP